MEPEGKDGHVPVLLERAQSLTEKTGEAGCL